MPVFAYRDDVIGSIRVVAALLAFMVVS